MRGTAQPSPSRNAVDLGSAHFTEHSARRRLQREVTFQEAAGPAAAGIAARAAPAGDSPREGAAAGGRGGAPAGSRGIRRTFP